MRNQRLDVGEKGPAKFLDVGDTFVFVDGKDAREHEVTSDNGSHFEYDSRPNKVLSKDVLVKRVGEHDPGERTKRVVDALHAAADKLSTRGDVSEWSRDIADVIHRAISSGMPDEVALTLDKLEKVGTALFSRAGGKRHGRSALDNLAAADRKQWMLAVEKAHVTIQDGLMESLLREVISEVIKRCGSKWCLYSRKTGKRLGTHDSKASAERQERAIQAHKHGG